MTETSQSTNQSKERDDAKLTSSQRLSPRRRKRKRRKKALISLPEGGYPLLCFDTETTNHGELLELSVFDIDGNEVYHEYFKPRAKSWPTEIHHITPEMVQDCKRFSHHKYNVQGLLNSTKYLVGCALTNDLHTLKRYGIDLHGKHKVMDIQNWYWLLNDDSNRLEKHQTGLAAIAERYNLGFGEEQAHSATADTRLTLECFKALVEHFMLNKPTDSDISPAENTETFLSVNMDKIDRLYTEAYKLAMHEYRMMNSKGFINVVTREQGFSFKYTRFEPEDKEKIVLSVPVTDRVKAEIDLRKHFECKQVKGFTGIYNFDESDFEYIRQYRNTIDLDTFIAREKARQIEIKTAQERAAKAFAARKTRQQAIAAKSSQNKSTENPCEADTADKESSKKNKRRQKPSAKTIEKKTAKRAANRAIRSAVKKNI